MALLLPQRRLKCISCERQECSVAHHSFSAAPSRLQSIHSSIIGQAHSCNRFRHHPGPFSYFPRTLFPRAPLSSADHASALYLCFEPVTGIDHRTFTRRSPADRISCFNRVDRARARVPCTSSCLSFIMPRVLELISNTTVHWQSWPIYCRSVVR